MGNIFAIAVRRVSVLLKASFCMYKVREDGSPKFDACQISEMGLQHDDKSSLNPVHAERLNVLPRSSFGHNSPTYLG